MMVSKYSALMSVYHKEKPEYLKQAIESIQAQTLPTDDFVLVCDGPLNDALDEIITKKQQEMGTRATAPYEGRLRYVFKKSRLEIRQGAGQVVQVYETTKFYWEWPVHKELRDS